MSAVRSAARGLGFLLALALVACRGGPDTPATAILITQVPEAATGGRDRTAAIAGRVTGAHEGDRVVLYARSGVWWVQPLAAQPFTEVDRDGNWRATTHLGTEYAALLVASGHHPPATLDRLPAVGGFVRGLVVVPGTGSRVEGARQVVSFSGYEWEVRDAASDRGGSNYYDRRNVRVDEAGHLRLRLMQRDGRWTGAEVSLTRPLGYGTYVFTIADTSGMEPAAVLGLLTWDDGAADVNHRELDVEISRWGDAGIDNAQYVVQPYYVAANVRRFAAPAGRLSHRIRWEPGRAAFSTERPGGAGVAAVATHEFTSGVPVAGDERVRMHLYPFGFSATPIQREVEVVIEKFQYLP